LVAIETAAGAKPSDSTQLYQRSHPNNPWATKTKTKSTQQHNKNKNKPKNRNPEIQRSATTA
jgi:hypothetical protein